MKVNITRLEETLVFLLSRLKDSKGNEIELNGDFYWEISPKEIYDPYNNPKTITLGQLSDDLEEVQKVLDRQQGMPHDLKRIANILIALSIENPVAF